MLALDVSDGVKMVATGLVFRVGFTGFYLISMLAVDVCLILVSFDLYLFLPDFTELSFNISLIAGFGEGILKPEKMVYFRLFSWKDKTCFDRLERMRSRYRVFVPSFSI